MDFAHLTNPRLLLEFASYGGLAAFIAGMVKEGRIALPRLYHTKDEDGQVRAFIDPGFISTILLGGLGAAVLDGRPITAVVYGIASAYLGREMLKPLVESLLKVYLPQLSLNQPPAALPAVAPTAAKE